MYSISGMHDLGGLDGPMVIPDKQWSRNDIKNAAHSLTQAKSPTGTKMSSKLTGTRMTTNSMCKTPKNPPRTSQVNSRLNASGKPKDERDEIEADLRRYTVFFGSEECEFDALYKRVVPATLHTDFWKETFERKQVESKVDNSNIKSNAVKTPMSK